MNLEPSLRQGSTHFQISPGRVLALLLAMACASALLCTNARAAEEQTHFFDATLSLTGDCSTSSIDPIPDPGCPGGEHPSQPFTKSGADAVDPSGDRYVASTGRIDVFGPTGEFITEISVASPGVETLAVDSEGHLYVGRSTNNTVQPLLRFDPTKYEPGAGEIEYGAAPVVIENPVSSPAGVPAGQWWGTRFPMAIDPTNDHLLVLGENHVTEFSSAKEENTFLRLIQLEGLVGEGYPATIALDAVRERLYVNDFNESTVSTSAKPVIKAYALNGSANPEVTFELLFTIDGSTTPTGRWASETQVLPVAVDEETGHIFVGDLEAPTRRVYEFDADGNPVSTIEGLFKPSGAGLSELAYDDSPTSPTQGYLFVPSGSGPGHSLAFRKKPATTAPLVEGLSVSGVTPSDAVLRGTVDPGGLETTYRIEYTTQQGYAEHGFEGATVAGEGTLATSTDAIPVSAAASDLAPGTAYRFRIVARNSEGEDEAEATFATYPPPETFTDCPNQALRTGASTSLPDCRAYELVTPVNTGGHAPLGTGIEPSSFTNRQVEPAGNKLWFRIEGGSLPGQEATGSFNGDPYLATRTSTGWSSAYVGVSPVESASIEVGSASPDQEYYAFIADGKHGPLPLGDHASYVHYPDGQIELLGQGSLGRIDPEATIQLISDGGTHIIFNTSPVGPSVQLEPDAAPDNTKAIYDRTPDGTTHVISLKPGNLPFEAGDNASLRGMSLDGRGVAFAVGTTLYLRYDDTETFEIGEGVEAAGVAEGGSRVFYVEGGDLWRFDANGETRTRFTEVGDAVPVYVSADGSSAYFVSKTVVPGSGSNPEGVQPQAGAQNLYRSQEGQVKFVATVTERDVVGAPNPSEENIPGAHKEDGLGLWTKALDYRSAGRFSFVPARATADGEVLLFKSRADLTGYDSAGHAEIYRYDLSGESLRCLSCNPTGLAASSDAELQHEREMHPPASHELFTEEAWLANLTEDGSRAFFESSEALVAGDTDGLKDVYEWEEQGAGSCGKANGCIYLISSGHSAHNEYLWAVSRSGDDVFFRSGDLLAGGDTDETPSIYDARVNGGFPSPPSVSGECLGEACQPAAVVPNDPTPASSAYEGAGNVSRGSGGRLGPNATRALGHAGGKRRCVHRRSRRHQHHSHQKRGKHAKSNGRTGR